MGFAAEIKEFLGAAKDSWKLMSDTQSKDADIKYKNVLTAEKQKEMDDPLNQQLKEAKLAQTRASTANIGRETPLQRLQRMEIEQRIAAMNNPQPQGAAALAAPPMQRPAIGAPARVETDPEPVPLMRRGGLVRKFAEGGVVEDEDLEDDVTSGVMPPAIGGATDFSSQSRQQPGMLTPPAIGAQPQRRAVTAPAVGGVPMPREKPRELQAVTDALKYGVTQLPPPSAIGASGGRSRALRGYAQGAGAAPPEDMLAIYKKIDPSGEMGESERNMYAMQAIHQYKLNQGDAEGAAKSAFQMLQHYKTAATRYAALSKAAMDGGHVDEGIKLALKAYAQVPDGNDMKLYKGKDGRIGYEMKDKDGNQISGGIATPEEIGAAAMKLATPGGFENHLVQMTSGAKVGGKTVGAGGKKEEEEPDVLGAKPPKPADYKEIKRESIDNYVDEWDKARQLGPDGKPKEGAKLLEPKELAATKNMLYHLRRHNDVTEDQGLQRIQTILSAPDPKKGETPAFKVTEDKEEKSRTILFPDGGELTIPNTQFGLFKSARAEAQAQRAKAAADKAKEDAETAARGGKSKVGYALDKADEYFNKGALATGEEIASDPSVRAIRDAAVWLKNKANSPDGDLPGIPELARRGTAAVGSALSSPATAGTIDPSEDRPL
jgi:hypothetical protein